jgi:hypothetical protein
MKKEGETMLDGEPARHYSWNINGAAHAPRTPVRVQTEGVTSAVSSQWSSSIKAKKKRYFGVIAEPSPALD